MLLSPTGKKEEDGEDGRGSGLPATPHIIHADLTFACRSSFGDPNAQPPTPKQTPTSSIFPSPVFETPRNNHGRFDESNGWTPKFAEDYSVFNSTPGNLRGSQGPFVDFVPATPYHPSARHKRPLSAGGIAAEIATHVNHFSPNPENPLPPVEPARRLQSSSTQAEGQGTSADTEKETAADSAQERSSKKARRAGTLNETSAQTATPPPSARKGERKLAPKLQTDTMQDDHGFGHQDFMGTPQQQLMPSFVTTPTDMYGYPLSAPATAPVFSGRNFWAAPDGSMTGMDMSLAAAVAGSDGTDVFQTPTPAQRAMGSMDWALDDQLFASAAGPSPTMMGQAAMTAATAASGAPAMTATTPLQQQGKRPRPLAPKGAVPSVDKSMVETAGFVGGSFQSPMDDPFAMVSANGGVNPGLLFSRPPSSSMDASGAAFVPMSQAELPSNLLPAAPGQLGSNASAGQDGDLRRSASFKDVSATKRYSLAASSPIKPLARPGLNRSLSEGRKKTPGRLPSNSLQSIAPGTRSFQPLATTATTGPGRPPRLSGRTSPLKTHHQRLSSLSSIPEAAASTERKRTSIKFTIDARGRARAEVVDEPSPTRQSFGRLGGRRDSGSYLGGGGGGVDAWGSSDDDSSTDDEPIILPPRRSSKSFALPDPVPAKPSASVVLHQQQSRKSLLEQQRRASAKDGPHFSFSVPGGDGIPNPFSDERGSNDDDESDAETIRDEPSSSQNGAKGDATTELRRLMEDRQSTRQQQQQHIQLHPAAAALQQRQRFGSMSGASAAAAAPSYHGAGASLPSNNSNVSSNMSNTISPTATSLTDASYATAGLPTPSTDPRSSHHPRPPHEIRCECGQVEADESGGGDGFMVQW